MLDGESERMILAALSERVRRCALAADPGAHPVEQHRDADVVVGQPRALVLVAEDDLSVEGEMGEVHAFEVHAEPSAVPFETGAHRRDVVDHPDHGLVGDLPGRRVAAIRFSGIGSDASLAEQEERLRAWLAAHELTAAGEPDYAFYNSPFVPGPLRRNEVLIPLAG